MRMLSGVYFAQKKDGTGYYRSNITYKNKHISLGSFPTEEKAHEAYCVARNILDGQYHLEELLDIYTPQDSSKADMSLDFEKAISLLNFRDKGIYLANPIYMRQNYFCYFLSATEELKFDIDDLFYYSRHKIMRRQGHLYVNDYGMQVTVMSRYGLRNYSVCGRDYYFANGDETDLRYSNVIVVNRYYGVTAFSQNGKKRYRVKIHINGNYTVGTYSTEEKAAVAYNKAADLARKAGISRNFQENYVDSLSAQEYADLYREVTLSQKYMEYLRTFLN
jgi:hypothetical protein